MVFAPRHIRAAVALAAALSFAACNAPDGAADVQGAVEQDINVDAEKPSAAPSAPPEYAEVAEVPATIGVEGMAVYDGSPYVAALPMDSQPAVAPTTPPTPAPAPVTPPAPVYEHEYFVSTFGSDSAPGTAAAPFRSIAKAIRMAQAGDRIVVRAGTYREDLQINASTAAEGTATKKILLQGEGRPKLLATGATHSVVHVQRRNWIIDGFEIDPEARRIFGVSFYGTTDGSVLSNSDLHGGTGAGVNIFSNASGVTVEKNTIHHFNAGEIDAHGVAIQWTTRNITVRGNRIYSNSGDSVQCEGPEPYGSYVPADGIVIENNDMSADRENAVDIKTCTNVVIRNNHMHDYTAYAGGTALVIHMSPKGVLVENNLIENVGKGIAVGGNRVGALPAGVVIRRNRIRSVLLSRGPGEGMRIENANMPVIANNTIIANQGPALVIGGGTNGSTESLKLQNNILSGAVAIKIGPYAPGFSSVSNLFENGSRIQTTAGLVDTVSWVNRGVDVRSRQGPAPLALSTNWAPITAAVNAGTALLGITACGSAPDIGAVETGC